MNIDKLDLELSAWELQREIWRNRAALGIGQLSPLQMLHPHLAAKVLGVQLEYRPELGRFGDGRERYEIAGALDRNRGVILVSTRFKGEVPRFTAAHELGHWVRHPQQVMHRDRPVTGAMQLAAARSPLEQEADYFAACFLMPRRLVKQALESTFGIKDPPLIIDEGAAFWLRPEDPDSLIGAGHGSMERYIAVAGARSFGTVHFHSLAEQFRVSVTAMAIRLKELGLVQEYP